MKRLLFILLLGLGGCSTLNPSVTDVLHRFCEFHRSDIAQVLLTPQQQAAGAIVCQAVGEPLGSPD